MDEYDSLNHKKWKFKYHVVFIPKYRRNALYSSLHRRVGGMFNASAMEQPVSPPKDRTQSLASGASIFTFQKLRDTKAGLVFVVAPGAVGVGVEQQVPAFPGGHLGGVHHATDPDVITATDN